MHRLYTYSHHRLKSLHYNVFGNEKNNAFSNSSYSHPSFLAIKWRKNFLHNLSIFLHQLSPKSIIKLLRLFIYYLKILQTCVSVPVLSEKIYWIWPNSSFNVVVLAFAYIFLCLQYISLSQLMRKLCINLITSTLKHKNHPQQIVNARSRFSLYHFLSTPISLTWHITKSEPTYSTQ